jgi:hypothetical protein
LTDESAPGGAGSPHTPANSASEGPVQPPSGQPPSAQPPSPEAGTTGKQPGKWRAPIIIVGIVAFLAIVLFVVRNNVAADDLKVGTCFDIPNGTSIQTVEQHPCNESHNAEVIFVGEHDGTTYPISLALDRFVEDNCAPAFETYVGTDIESSADLAMGYLYPDRDGWESGDRTITCYVGRSDESPMTESLKGSAIQ